MKFFFQYLRQKLRTLLCITSFIIIFSISFALYHLPIAAVLYPAFVCFIIGCILIIVDFKRVREKHITLKKMQYVPVSAFAEIPEYSRIDDADYRKIISVLCKQYTELEDLTTAKYNHMIDYYTLWVHQIRTPITAMYLQLQTEDSQFSRALQSELFKIEQYVEMVITFLRLDSEYSDYVLRTYQLDSIIKQAVKKFASEFILRKLSLEFTPTNISVVTDEKWLSFVIEQIISNALKYTPNGKIKIYAEEQKILCIEDTGLGISPEDLPRIFEKGFTGFNGREHQKASGLGLYLCKRVCNNLAHKISAESVPGIGTKIKINFSQKNIN